MSFSSSQHPHTVRSAPTYCHYISQSTFTYCQYFQCQHLHSVYVNLLAAKHISILFTSTDLCLCLSIQSTSIYCSCLHRQHLHTESIQTVYHQDAVSIYSVSIYTLYLIFPVNMHTQCLYILYSQYLHIISYL